MAEQELTKKKRFDKRDFETIAAFIIEEHGTRKRKRKDMEAQWAEIDRQLAMTPKVEYKINPFTGRKKPGMAWLPEKELPLQAQTLEILCADARRMMFPDNGPWFRAHALVSDEYLSKVNMASLISGDENDVPSKINQDNVDKLVEGIMGDIHEESGFFAQIDRFNAEAFKYGTGVGRVRKARKPVYIETARGTTKEESLLPIFFATSIKDTYLDETPQFVMQEGHVLGPATIFFKRQKLADLKLAAKQGSKDPENEDGGWMPAMLNDVEDDKDGCVDVYRWEGDLVIDRKTTDSMYIPGAIVTVVGGGDPKVVRMAFREKPFSSYVTQPYHIEQVNSPYGVGPLMKGEPLQAAATEMFCRLLQSAILNTEPPVQYDPDDPGFAATGGPVIEPRALWASSGTVIPHQIGKPGDLLQAYSTIVTHYADVTGMHAPRLGQQTVSHTTAYAKEAELSRGQVRTVDYANSLIDGALGRILDMQFSYLKDIWTTQRDIWIPDYGGFVKIIKDAIPDGCVFEIFGSAGPAEQRARLQDQMGAVQQVIQIDALQRQFGVGQPMDYDLIKKLILKNAGFADVDVLFATEQPQPPQQPPGPSQGAPGDAQGGPPVPGIASGNPGTASTALQALAFGGKGGG
jgi:hypothetical protein